VGNWLIISLATVAVGFGVVAARRRSPLRTLNVS